MPYFDRFDVCEAYYLFATDYHEGQWSETYRIFGRLQQLRFQPSPGLSRRSLTSNGRQILASLIRRYRRERSR